MLKPNASREEIESNSHHGLNTENNTTPVLDSFLLEVDPRDKSVCQCLIRDSYWESWITSWMSRVIKDDWNCLDIGANYGYYTGVMSRLTNGEVQSFEANPEIAKSLQRSVEINGFENVTINPFALGSKSDVLPLSLARGYQGSGSMALNEQYFKSWDTDTYTFDVEVRPLDQVIDDHGKWDLIKIDVEGWEPEVFAGAERLLRTSNPLIAIEISKDHPVEFVDSLFERYDVTNIGLSGAEEPITRFQVDSADWWMLALRSKGWN